MAASHHASPQNTAAAQPAPRLAGTFAWAVAGMVLFGACAVALHAAHWGEWPRYLSLFHLGADGLLWDLGLVGLGLGSLALAFAIAAMVPGTSYGRLALAAMVAASIAVLLMVACPTDRHFNGDRPTTASGMVHDGAAVAAALLQGCAMVLAVRVARRDPAWAVLVGRSHRWGATYLSVMGLWVGLEMTTTVAAASFLQRVVAGLGYLWSLRIGLRGLATFTPPSWALANRSGAP